MMINFPHVNLKLHEIIKLHEAYLSHIASLVKKNICRSLKMGYLIPLGHFVKG